MRTTLEVTTSSGDDDTEQLNVLSNGQTMLAYLRGHHWHSTAERWRERLLDAASPAPI